MNEQSVPKIRFKGFTGPWKMRKLGEIAVFNNGRAYKQEELLSTGKYPVLRVGNFYTNSKWYFSNLELDQKYYASNGDLLYTWSATFGPHIWNGKKVIYHYHIWKIDLSDQLIKIFALHLLESDKNKMSDNSNGSTMIHITKHEMEEKTFAIPSVAEQKYIGNILDVIDSLIVSNERKLEQLKKTKKLLMQKIFSQEWRFKGFTDAWEPRQLKDVTNPVEGNDGELESNFDVLTISVAHGWMKQRDRFSQVIAGKELKNYTLLHPGELSYNHGNSKLAKFGAVFELRTQKPALVPRVYHSFKAYGSNPSFIEHLFATKLPDQELRKLVTSGARMDGLLNINKTAFLVLQ